jgi:hypothetical protein
MDASSVADDEAFLNERNKTKLVLEAEALRARAKAILAEARAMELELKESRSKLSKDKRNESDKFIEQLFPYDYKDMSIAANSTAVAEVLQRERWSAEQVLKLVDQIFERQAEASGQTMTADNAPKVVNETEYERLSDALDTLLTAVAQLDAQVLSSDQNSPRPRPSQNQNQNQMRETNSRWTGRVETAVRSRLNELRRTQQLNMDRKMAAEMNKVANSNQSVEDYVRRTLGESIRPNEDGVTKTTANSSEVSEKVALVPMWVPSSFLPFIITSQKSTLGPEQVTAIQDRVLVGSQFYVTSSDSVPGAAIFRGNIRTPAGSVTTDEAKNQTARVFSNIQDRLKSKGLQDKVQLFMMPDPEWRPSRDERESEPKPVILALSKEISPDESAIEKGAVADFAKVSSEQQV